jgi:hypothetical protein
MKEERPAKPPPRLAPGDEAAPGTPGTGTGRITRGIGGA